MQNLVEKIVRSKIYDCQYWKEHCFGLTAESLIDKAVALRSAGGPAPQNIMSAFTITRGCNRLAAGQSRCLFPSQLQYVLALPPFLQTGALSLALDVDAGGTFGGARKPCEFMCLTLKLLQLQPDKDIIIEYIKNEEFKYVRILGGSQDTACTSSGNAVYILDNGSAWLERLSSAVGMVVSDCILQYCAFAPTSRTMIHIQLVTQGDSW